MSMMGGHIPKRIHELSFVDSDSNRREEHAYIVHSSFWPEMPLFSAIMSIFAPLEAGRPIFRGFNDSSDINLMYGDIS